MKKVLMRCECHEKRNCKKEFKKFGCKYCLYRSIREESDRLIQCKLARIIWEAQKTVKESQELDCDADQLRECLKEQIFCNPCFKKFHKKICKCEKCLEISEKYQEIKEEKVEEIAKLLKEIQCKIEEVEGATQKRDFFEKKFIECLKEEKCDCDCHCKCDCECHCKCDCDWKHDFDDDCDCHNNCC